jgi:hypothetical protein
MVAYRTEQFLLETTNCKVLNMSFDAVCIMAKALQGYVRRTDREMLSSATT